MHYLKRNIIVAVFMVFILLMTACNQKSTQTNSSEEGAKHQEKKVEKGKKDNLVIVQSTENRDLTDINPLQKDTTLPRSMVFDTLLVKSGGELKPSLAESYESNGNAWRFKIKEGIAFHNGDPLDAESVKATFDRILDKNVKTSYKFGFGGVKEVKVVDKYTVDIISEQPNYVIPNFIAEVPILSAKQLASGDSYKTELNGTGPYSLADWKRGEQITLKKNENYWGEKPEFPGVVIKYVSDESTRIAELLSGSADIASDISEASVDRIKEAKGHAVVSEPGLRVTWMSYSIKPPFDNQKFRQAIYYAMDRKSLAENLFGDFASPATSPVVEGGAGYVKAFPTSDFNLEKAKKLIEESGIKPPVKVDFDVIQTDVDIAQIVQAQLKEIGVETTINIIDNANIFDPTRYEARTNGTIFLATKLDNPEKDVYRTYVPTFTFGGAFEGMFGYKPLQEVDDLVKQYVSEPNKEKRTEISKKVLELTKEDASILWLMHPSNIYGISDAIDWKPDGTGRIDIHQIKVK